MEATRPDLFLTLPYTIKFVVRRAEDDGDDRPCVFYWNHDNNATSPVGFVLLHHKAEAGLDAVAVDHSGVTYENDPEALVVDGWQSHYLRQLAPGGEYVCWVTLPERYYHALEPGETYTLLYPGLRGPHVGMGHDSATSGLRTGDQTA